MAVKKRVCVCVFQICILFVHTLTTQMQRGSRFHCFFVIVSKLLCISLTTYHFSRTSGMGLNKKYTHKHQPTLSSPSSITPMISPSLLSLLTLIVQSTWPWWRITLQYCRPNSTYLLSSKTSQSLHSVLESPESLLVIKCALVLLTSGFTQLFHTNNLYVLCRLLIMPLHLHYIWVTTNPFTVPHAARRPVRLLTCLSSSHYFWPSYLSFPFHISINLVSRPVLVLHQQ